MISSVQTQSLNETRIGVIPDGKLAFEGKLFGGILKAQELKQPEGGGHDYMVTATNADGRQAKVQVHLDHTFSADDVKPGSDLKYTLSEKLVHRNGAPDKITSAPQGSHDDGGGDITHAVKDGAKIAGEAVGTVFKTIFAVPLAVLHGVVAVEQGLVAAATEVQHIVGDVASGVTKVAADGVKAMENGAVAIEQTAENAARGAVRTLASGLKSFTTGVIAGLDPNLEKAMLRSGK